MQQRKRPKFFMLTSYLIVLAVRVKDAIALKPGEKHLYYEHLKEIPHIISVYFFLNPI